MHLIFIGTFVIFDIYKYVMKLIPKAILIK